MSINTSHTGDGFGVILFNGECNILYCTRIELKLVYNTQFNSKLEEGYYAGALYLTTHRLIFIANNIKSKLLSFSMPHVFLHGVKVRKQLGKYQQMSGEVEAEPNGGFHGRFPFVFIFQKDGATEFYEALASLALRSCQAGRFWKPGSLFKTHFPHDPLYHAPKKIYHDVFLDPQFKFVRRHIAFEPIKEKQIFMHKIIVPLPGFFECISTPESLNLAVPMEPDPKGRGKAYRNPTIYNTYWTPCSKPVKEGLVCHDSSDFINYVQHYQGPYYSGPMAGKVAGECECKQLVWEVPEHCKCRPLCDPCLETGCIPYLCDKYTMVHMCHADKPCHTNVFSKCE